MYLASGKNVDNEGFHFANFIVFHSTCAGTM